MIVAPMTNVVKTCPSCAKFPGAAVKMARANQTARAITPMTPTKNRTIEITTFRECVAPNALRPKITRMAPINTSNPPMAPTKGKGIHPIADPTSRRSTPIFVRSTCF